MPMMLSLMMMMWMVIMRIEKIYLVSVSLVLAVFVLLYFLPEFLH